MDLYADTEYAQAESQEIVVVAKFDFPGVESEVRPSLPRLWMPRLFARLL